jgi:hypothetical protein
MALPDAEGRARAPEPGEPGAGPQAALSPEHIMEVGLGFWGSKTLLSAVEMEIFTHLASRPLELEALRARAGLHPRAARDFLDALVAMGFLERSDGVYGNAPATDLFLDKRKPSYVGGILEMANARLFRFWNGLTEALRTGEVQNEAKGGGAPFFTELYADPKRLEQFAASMTGVSRGVNMQLATHFPWKDYASVADIGTAQGGEVPRAVCFCSTIAEDLAQELGREPAEAVLVTT